MNPAFVAANALKGNAATPRIFALGVGAAVSNAGSLTRLQAISGTTEFTGSNSFANSDYALVDNFDDLGPALAQIAAALCSVRLHVVKQVDELDGQGFQPANGWDFTGTVSVSGGAPASFKWLAPGAVEGPPVANRSRTAATATIRESKGRLDFVWLPTPDDADQRHRRGGDAEAGLRVRLGVVRARRAASDAATAAARR